MPSATQELQDLMLDWFGDIDDAGPTRILESRGWRLVPNWKWKPPVPHYTIHHIDYILIMFLVQEWDYGGVDDDPWFAPAERKD